MIMDIEWEGQTRHTPFVLFAGFVLLILSVQAAPIRSARSAAQAQTGVVAHSLYLSVLFKQPSSMGLMGL